MDTYLTGEIIKALASGDVTKFFAYIIIFVFIWIEVRGMKTQLSNLNETVSKSFAAGEKRMEAIEKHNVQIERRLSGLETKGVKA